MTVGHDFERFVVILYSDLKEQELGDGMQQSPVDSSVPAPQNEAVLTCLQEDLAGSVLHQRLETVLIVEAEEEGGAVVEPPGGGSVQPGEPVLVTSSIVGMGDVGSGHPPDDGHC